MADDNKQTSDIAPMPGKQEGKPIPHGLRPGKGARENGLKRGPGRPQGSVNRYTGALKELYLMAAENVGDRTKLGPNGERHGDGGALAYLETSAILERKTFMTVMARLLPITIKTAPPIKKVLTREEALHELRVRGLDPELMPKGDPAAPHFVAARLRRLPAGGICTWRYAPSGPWAEGSRSERLGRPWRGRRRFGRQGSAAVSAGVAARSVSVGWRRVTHYIRGHRRGWEWSLSNSCLSASFPARLAIVMV